MWGKCSPAAHLPQAVQAVQENDSLNCALSYNNNNNNNNRTKQSTDALINVKY